MRLRLLSLATSLLAAFLWSTSASALGLGEIKVKSSLNQPLEAEIRLLQIRDLTEEEILVGLASNADFERVGVDKTFFLTGMRFEVDLEASGGPIVKVTTSSPVREPFLNFLVESQWPSGRILREYTLLMDLPVFSAQSEAQVQAPAAAPPSATPAPSPAPAPRATPSVPTSSSRVTTSTSGDTFGPVQANDTLWEIALQVRPSRDVSIQQTMIAIQRLNPEAFINGNINLLRRGQVLRIPDAGQIAQLNQRQAVTEVAFQNDQWDSTATGPTLSGGSGSSAPSTPQSTGGRVSLGVSEASAGSSSRGSAGGSSAALENDLAIAQDQLDSATRENSELKNRIAELEEQIETMERLVTVTNDELRALQLASQLSDDDAANEVTAEATTAAVEEADPAEETDPAEAVEEETQTADVAAAAEPEAEVEAKPPVRDTRNVVVSQPVQKKTLMDTIMDNIVLVAVGAVALLVLILILVKKLFGGKDEEVDEDTFDPFAQEDEATDELALDEPELELPDDEPLDQEPELAADSELEETLETSDAVEDLSDVVPEELIAEADIYIAYGKYDQAEEMLDKALRASPDNQDAHVKLMELYAESDQLEKFDQTLTKVHASGDNASITRGNQLREKFTDALPFAGIAAAGAAVAAMAAADTADEPEISFEEDLADLDNSLADELEFNLDTEVDSFLAEEPLELDVADEAIDPMGETQTLDSLADEITQSAAAEADTLDLDAEISLDEDLDLDLDPDTAVEIDFEPGEQSPELDIDLADDVEGAFSIDSALDQIDEQLEPGAELDLDLDSVTEAAESLDLDSTLEETSFDLADDQLESADTEIELPEAEEESQAPQAEPEAAPSLDIDDIDLDGDELDEGMFAEIDADLGLDGDEGLDLELEPMTDEEPELALEVEQTADPDEGSDEPSEESFSFTMADEADELELEPEISDDPIENDALDQDLDLSDQDMELSLQQLDEELDLNDSDLELEMPSETEQAAAEFATDVSDLEVPSDDSLIDEIQAADLPTLDDSQLDEDLSLDLDIEPEQISDDELLELDEETSALASDVGSDPVQPLSDLDDTLSSDSVFDEVLAEAGLDDDEGTDNGDDEADSSGDDLDFIANMDESDTKLDLARAYIDMGDSDGARDILEEVIQEGNDQQKSEAQGLIETIPS